MLRAIQTSTSNPVLADSVVKSSGSFKCPECHEPVILKSGRVRINHFARVNPVACKFATGESYEHRRCKLEIYQARLRAQSVTDFVLERPLGSVRPDVSATINGARVAIEVQISTLSMDAIIQGESRRRGFTGKAQ